MKNNFLRIFIIFLVGGLLVFSATLFYVNSKIQPEKIKNIIINTIETNLVNSKASIASLDYSLGQKIIFTLESLKIKNSNNEIITLDKIKVYIPIISILTSGGVVDINLSGSKVNLEKVNGELNLKRMLPKQKDKSSRSFKLEIPKFLEKSRINLKVTNTSIKYKDGKEASDFQVNKVIMKNINLKKTTAFELQTDINMMVKGKKLATSITLIGEIPLKNIIEATTAKIDLMVQTDSLTYGDYLLKASRHRGVLTYTSPQKVSVNLRSELDGLLNGDLDATLINQKFSIKKVEYNLNVENILKTLKLEDQLNEKSVKFSNLNIIVKGSASYDLNNGDIVPNLAISTLNQFKFEFKNLDLNPTFSLNLINSDLLFKLESAFEKKGLISFDLKTKLNLKNIKELSPIDLNINASDLNLEIPRVSLVEIANRPKAEIVNDEPQGSQLNLQALANVPDLKVTLRVENSNFNKIPFSFESLTSFSKRKLITKNFLFNFPEAGKINSNNIEVDLTEDKKISGKGELLFDLNLLYFESLLPLEVQKVKGQMNGSVGVMFELEKELNYQTQGKLNIKDGSIKDFYIYDFVKPIISKYSFLKQEAKKNKEVSTTFSLLSSQFKMSKQEIILSKLMCNGIKDEFKVDGRGTLKLKETETSKVYLNIALKAIQSDLKRHFAKTKLPLMLVGKGFVITPDVSYTTKKLGKSLIKNTRAKVKKELNKRIKIEKNKINKKINKEKKKVEDKLQKEAEKMLKGIKL